MKPTTKTAFMGIAFGILTFITTWQFLPRELHAVEGGVGEQYKILNMVAYPNEAAVERALNQLGQQGWKVRTAALGNIILAK